MSGIYVFGIVPKHSEERMPAPVGLPEAGEHEDAFDHELSDKPQPYFPAEEADDGAKQS